MDLKHADRQTSYANRATPRPTGPPPMIANLTKTHGNHIFNFLSSKLLDVEINRKNHSRKPKKKKKFSLNTVMSNVIISSKFKKVIWQHSDLFLFLIV